MKRLPVILFNSAMVLSFFLLVGAVVLWLRAGLNSDYAFFKSRDSGYLVFSGESGVQFCRASLAFYGNLTGPWYQWEHYGFGYYRFRRTDENRLMWLRLPHWLLIVLTSILPTVAVARWWLRGQPPPAPWVQGLLCRRCGYNLTGNVSGRCPECGIRIPGRPLIGKKRF